MLHLLNDNPFAFWLIFAYFGMIAFIVIFGIRLWIAEILISRTDCRYHTYDHRMEIRREGKCSGCFQIPDSLFIQRIIGYCIGAFFALLFAPIFIFGTCVDSRIERTFSWPLNRKQAQWTWHNGVLFLPVIATVLVWLIN